MLAKRAGATDDQIAAIGRGGYAAFEPGWGAALAFAAETVPVGGAVSDAAFARLAEFWDPPQIVEITTTCTVFAHFNRIANALQIPVTR
jgi:alkylhydroperoxidase family enzyme